MSIEDTYEGERTKWGALAQQKLPTLRALPPSDNFYLYARRTNTMDGVGDFLGDLRGKRVLEYGCGLGEVAVLLAKSGAKVTTFDLSTASVVVGGPAFWVGVPVPWGVRLLGEVVGDLIPWTWRIHGAASVIASVGAIPIAMQLGYRATRFIAGGCYVAAWALGGLTFAPAPTRSSGRSGR